MNDFDEKITAQAVATDNIIITATLFFSSILMILFESIYKNVDFFYFDKNSEKSNTFYNIKYYFLILCKEDWKSSFNSLKLNIFVKKVKMILEMNAMPNDTIQFIGSLVER